MKLTILETGTVPEKIAAGYPSYPEMFRAMFEREGTHFQYEVIAVHTGDPLPDPAGLEAILITGSAAGVYEDHAWLEPLRGFVRGAYDAGIRMVGICFGHQIIADALGGEVSKSGKGWGLGRHTYEIRHRPPFLDAPAISLSVVCSHQDQVITPPADARVILASEFTPNAGLVYRNDRTLSFQPHPEFSDRYAEALMELRRGRITDEAVDEALRSMAKPSDSPLMVRAISNFLNG